MSGPPCERCAPRGLLLAELAEGISVAVDNRAGRRARDLLALDDLALALAVTPDEETARRAVERSHEPAMLRTLVAGLEASGCWMLCRHDERWPAALALLAESEPRALYGRGDPSAVSASDPVTVVGARRAGAYGREVAESIAFGLASAGVGIVSGLAMGIDSAAHRGAARAGEGGLGVLAAGPERPYPRLATAEYRGLVGAGGAIVSELPPASPVRRWMFPARNRLMAALGRITIVVEAAERSGSLITAEMAADCGRSVGAVPGPVNSWRSAGANALLVDGAVPVRGAADVLEHLYGPGAGAAAAVRSGPQLSDGDGTLLDAIERGAATADALATELRVDGPSCAAGLARLELAGYVEVDFAGSITRTLLERAGRGRAAAANTMDR